MSPPHDRSKAGSLPLGGKARSAKGAHKDQEFRAQHAMGERVAGIALVARDGFSARYDLDRIRGTFCRPQHKLAGQSYVGCILVLDTAKGGVASAWMLHEMKSRGMIPLGFVFNSVNPIIAQGTALADLTMLAGFDCDITDALHSGVSVELVPVDHILRVRSSSRAQSVVVRG